MATSAAALPSKASQRLGEVAGVCVLGLVALLALSLVSFDATDPSWFNASTKSHVTNLVGEPGAFVAALLVHAFGLAAGALVLGAGVVALRMILGAPSRGRVASGVGLALVTVSACALLDLAIDRVLLGGDTILAGGLLGYEVDRQLRATLNGAGAAVTLGTAGVLGTLLFTGASAARLLRAGNGVAAAVLTRGRTRLVRGVSSLRKDRMRREVIRRHAEEIREEIEKSRRDVAPPAPKELSEVAAAEPPSVMVPDAARADGAPSRPRRRAVIRERVAGFMEKERPPAGAGAAPVAGAAPAEQLSLPVTEPPEAPGLPPLSLLRSPEGELELDEKELFERGKALEAKFREFQVNRSLIEIHPGPVVTTYEYRPDPGIKYSRLTSLADDLCLALKAESIRIDRIAGKSTVGIEVPNPRRETIFLREVLTSEACQASTSPLTISMGKLINGEPHVSDLARMPHLLMAGATGQGKSVALNAMICTILFRARPEEVRFVMIDPKTVELTTYDGIPHLMCPVVTDPKLAANALKWATREMERRYKMLAGLGVRSIDQFNAILRSARPGERPQARPGYEGAFPPAGEELRPLPYVVVVIDELRWPGPWAST
jgi:S-DNA-T family DNA segregation ATPase FtsK/SpoIIIE